MILPELPRLESAILRWAIPDDWRPDIFRDLEEAYRARAASTPRTARLWLLGTVTLFALRFLPTRFRELGSGYSVSALDLRLAVRAIRKAPGLSLLNVVALALGIGIAAASFGLVRGAFFAPMPFDGGDRIFLVEDYNVTRSTSLGVDAGEYLRRRDRLSSFELLGAYSSRPVVLRGERRVTAAFVTDELLRLTSVDPAHGRLPQASDTRIGAPPTVVLPHSLWVALLGADPGAIGASIDIDGTPHTLIGVMPEGFGFPWNDELWIPEDPRASGRSITIIGKLREGVELESARVELASIAVPAPVDADEEVIHLITRLNRPVTGEAQLLALGVPIAILVLLLIVVALNVATVVLARNSRRTPELAVRVALGASRRRVVGQLALEVALTVMIGAAIGLALASWGLNLIATRVQGLPFWVDLSLTPVVVGFAVGLALLVTCVAGVAPGLKVTRGGLRPGLVGSGRGADQVRFGRLTDAIIVAELAVCVGFLCAAALLGRSLLSFTAARDGLPTAETLVANVAWAPPPGVPAEGTVSQPPILALVDAALALPGAQAAALGTRFPGDEAGKQLVEIEGGRLNEPVRAEVAGVDASYFELLSAQPLRGRVFTPDEVVSDAPVTIVDEPFVRAHLGAGGIGRRIRFWNSGAGDPTPGPWLEVVGVVPDVGLGVGDPSQVGSVFHPLGQPRLAWLGVRGEGDPERWIPALVERLRGVDPGWVVRGPQTLQALTSLPATVYRTLGLGFFALGAIALLLSAASLHALTSCAVSGRTRELGIRRALGAQSTGLVVSIARRSGAQVALGLLFGGVLAFALLQLATVFPWELGVGNPLLLTAVPGLLVLAVLSALAIPVTRALAIRPADALRHE